MRVVYIAEWFSHDMGYIENCLPFAVASLGHEVHMITSNAQVYYNSPFYKQSYASYLGDPIVPVATYKHKNITIHRLPFRHIRGKIVLSGLLSTIKSLKPDVVHIFEHTTFDTYRIAFLKCLIPFRFYTGNHEVLSVFPLAKNWKTTSLLRKLYWKTFNQIPGKIISNLIDKCYAVTEDAGYIATQFKGVHPNKLVVSTLGVDTTLFFPISDEEKQNRKQTNGFSKDDVVCIYTGRFTKEKHPLIVAEAIEELAGQGYPFRGLFVGEGEERPEIEKMKYCRVVNFIPYPQLPFYYQFADIGIWPGQESTSQLDAVASGLNLILTSNIKAYAPVETGNKEDTRPKIVSRFYTHFDKEDLKQQLLSLLDQEERKRLAALSVQEISQHYSWERIAERRIKDYLGGMN